MNSLVRCLRENAWIIYLAFYVIVFFVWRICFAQNNETIIEIYTNMYYEKRAMGIYILGYLLFLGPLCNKIINYHYAIRIGTKENQLAKLGKIMFIRSVMYSFMLNIVFYLMVGSATKDYLIKENIIRVMLQFLSQTVGWLFIGYLYLFIYLCVRQKIVAVSITYLILIALCLSNYVNYYAKLQYYLRLYYMMFHIEQYPSWSFFFGVLLFYMTLGLMFYVISYRRINKYEYY